MLNSPRNVQLLELSQNKILRRPRRTMVLTRYSRVMDQNRYHALIAAYFLSRDDQQAYEALGFITHKATHETIGTSLSVNPNTIKNMRDEFDSIHDNSRQGWYQRPIRPSRQKVVEQFSGLGFDALLAVVRNITTQKISADFLDIPIAALLPIATEDDNTTGALASITNASRSITGRKAEEAFREFFLMQRQPIDGELIDCRDLATGYDFEIRNANAAVFVEVKGLAGTTGSITLTGNEWRTAKLLGNRYYIALVFEVASSARVTLFANPGGRLTPILRVVSVMQEQWNVPVTALTGDGSVTTP